MELSTELISQFVKLTTPEKKKSETTSYGTIHKSNGKDYVRLDGSDIYTPVSSTASTSDGDRVMVLVKSHNAIITGNLSKPSANTVEVGKIDKTISEFYTVMSYKVSTDELSAIDATIESLKTKTATITDIESVTADIESLQSKFATLDHVYATDVDALNAEIENIRSEFANISTISTEDLDAINAVIDKLKGYTADFTYVSADILSALKAEVDKLDATHLQATYANIDFSNITESTMAKFYSNSGLIKDATIGDATITGELQGVTISGNLLKGSTVVADKLVLKGEDGLYYKLNTDGIKTEAEQTEYNSLNGDIFMAKSITATKINVSDLVAFGATIGGFKITDSSLYSGVKQTVGNTTRGIYLDNDGQIAFGDASKYIKFFKDTDSNYKLLISGAVTANENFKILTDGSMEAKNGSFKGTIDANDGSIGGIAISSNGISAESTSGTTRGFQITKNGDISSYNTGSGIDYKLAISSGTLTLSSEGTASGSNPTELALSSGGMYIKDAGNYVAKFYTNGSGANIDAQYGLSINGSLIANNEVTVNKTLTTSGDTTVKGVLFPKQGQYVHSANGGSTTSGYVLIARLAVTDVYDNQPLEIEFVRRGDASSTKLYVRFQSGNTSDPALGSFRAIGDSSEAYLYKSATSTWDLYIEKTEAYDTIDILSMKAGKYWRARTTITWMNSLVTTLPSGYTQARLFTKVNRCMFDNDVSSFITGRTGGGFDLWVTESGMRITIDETGSIYKVTANGTWTKIAG